MRVLNKEEKAIYEMLMSDIWVKKKTRNDIKPPKDFEKHEPLKESEDW